LLPLLLPLLHHLLVLFSSFLFKVLSCFPPLYTPVYDSFALNIVAKMALTIKSLNNDTTFLLTFTPPIAPAGHAKPEQFPGSFTILIDPWITGPAKIFSRKLSYQERLTESCISSLADLPEPDLVLVSQDQPDHCHQESLCTLPPDTYATVLAPAGAAKKIRKWQHFDHSCLATLPIYDPEKPQSVFRIEIPSFSPATTPGEVTICLLQAKRDMMGLHNAIGITYRAPHTILSASRSYINLPTPPHSPFLSATHGITSPSLTAPPHERDKPISVLYTPHGLSLDLITPWATKHLLPLSALPLSCMMHAFNSVAGPWFMGGNFVHGSPRGVEIAAALQPRVWVGAHDEEKRKTGLATRGIQTVRFDVEDVREKVGAVGGTEVVVLAAGESVRIAPEEEVVRGVKVRALVTKKSCVDMAAKRMAESLSERAGSV
jgi:L-ascorbate metabolism protein UlaG (beta-lactamase superfamily)